MLQLQHRSQLLLHLIPGPGTPYALGWQRKQESRKEGREGGREEGRKEERKEGRKEKEKRPQKPHLVL